MGTMIKHKLGHIVNVASLAGTSGTNKLVDYCASKFAAVGMDEALRVELNVEGHSDYIKTTVVCPYYISTGMFAWVQVLLPAPAIMKLARAVGFNCSIDQFKGRSKSD